MACKRQIVALWGLEAAVVVSLSLPIVREKLFVVEVHGKAHQRG